MSSTARVRPIRKTASIRSTAVSEAWLESQDSGGLAAIDAWLERDPVYGQFLRSPAASAQSSISSRFTRDASRWLS
jgi:hypothetical protein